MTRKEMLKLMGSKRTCTWEKVAEIVKKKYKELPKYWKEMIQSLKEGKTNEHHPNSVTCAACEMSARGTDGKQGCFVCKLFPNRCIAVGMRDIWNGIGQQNRKQFLKGCSRIVQQCDEFLLEQQKS